VLLVVSASDVVEAEADVAEDPCETCEVVPACLVVDEAAEVLVASNLIPQTFSASKVKSRFLAWHSVCWRSTDSACSSLEEFSLPNFEDTDQASHLHHISWPYSRNRPHGTSSECTYRLDHWYMNRRGSCNRNSHSDTFISF
jgi:hypothetical protein